MNVNVSDNKAPALTVIQHCE